MRYSERGLMFTAGREGCVLTVHRDTTSLARGFGINAKGLTEGDTLTMEQAITDLLDFADRALASLNIIFKGLTFSQHQADAIFSALFNIGPTWLREGNQSFINAITAHAQAPANRDLRELAGAGFGLLTGPPAEEGDKPRWPFNISRRARETVLYTTGDYGDISPLHPLIKPLVKGVPGELATLNFWPEGKSPKHTPPDPVTIIPMPRLL